MDRAQPRKLLRTPRVRGSPRWRSRPRYGIGGPWPKKKGAAVTAPVYREALLHRADLPDHPGTWNLDERAIGGADKMCIRAIVSHDAVIHDIGAPVWAEPDIRRAVEPVDHGYERLVVSAVAGKVLDPQGERRAWQLVEVDQLDLMSDFRIGIAGIRRREAEIASREYNAAPG